MDDWSQGIRCSAGHQTHWQDESKGGVQIRAEVMKMKGGEGEPNNKNMKGSPSGAMELQTLISVQKSAGEMPQFVVMHLSSKILHSKEVRSQVCGRAHSRYATVAGPCCSWLCSHRNFLF